MIAVTLDNKLDMAKLWLSKGTDVNLKDHMATCTFIFFTITPGEVQLGV